MRANRFPMFGVFLALCACLACGRDDAPQQKQPSSAPLVVIVTPLAHPSLDEAIRGFRRGLAEKGFQDDLVRFISMNGNGEFDKLPTLLRQAAERKPSLIFVVTTPAATAAAKLAAETGVPVVYTAVTDPVGAGIVASMESSEAPVTGVSDRYPVAEQVRFFTQLAKGLGTVCILFNPAEQNSLVLSSKTASEFEKLKVAVRKMEVTETPEIATKAKQAAAKCDALVVNGDNLIMESLETVIKVCVENKKPFFVGDPDSVRRGAIATVGPSYFQIGRQSGHKAARILNGESAGTIPSSFPTGFDYIVNFDAAVAMGLQIDLSALAQRSVWESRATSGTE